MNFLGNFKKKKYPSYEIWYELITLDFSAFTDIDCF